MIGVMENPAKIERMKAHPDYSPLRIVLRNNVLVTRGIVCAF